MSNETKILTGIGVATFVIVIAAAFLFGGKATPEKERAPLPAEVQQYLVRPDSYKKGAEKAKVTVVEFGDFQCPACASSHPIVKQLIANYKNDVTFVFREFPLPMHKNGKNAALAAEAAGLQGKFYQMHDLLFENQDKWAEGNNAKDIFVTYAEKLGLDIEKFKSAMNDKKLEEKIQRDITDGNAAGVNSTPTFFINGVEQAGGLPYDQFEEKIKKALKEK